jgi:hypothetical protein
MKSARNSSLLLGMSFRVIDRNATHWTKDLSTRSA